MKVKLDENLGSRAVGLFEESGHEVSTVTGEDLEGASDDDLIEACRHKEQVLVTLDLDFPNVLRYPPGKYPGIVVLRLPHPIELETIRERVRVLLRASEKEDLSGRLWIVEQNRIRQYDPT